MKAKNDRGLQPLGDILKNFDFDKKKYISREFQDYGYRLAEELGDLKRKALYMKFAKELPRPLLEEARCFVKDAVNARNKASLFMWKVTQLKKEQKKKKNGSVILK